MLWLYKYKDYHGLTEIIVFFMRSKVIQLSFCCTAEINILALKYLK